MTDEMDARAIEAMQRFDAAHRPGLPVSAVISALLVEVLTERDEALSEVAALKALLHRIAAYFDGDTPDMLEGVALVTAIRAVVGEAKA